MKRFFLTLLALTALATNMAAAEEAEQLFEQKVRPLLSRNCFECHSQKASELKGSLKLDSLEDIMRGGSNGSAIVAGDVENSFLLRAIRYQEADYQMPPRGRLTEEEIRTLEAWVKSLKDPKSKRLK